LYYFANDAGPGDVNGQGVNDVWYVLDPAGNGIGLAG
jgi:predicted lipoprotein with Yx(FWY)xxD motif